SSRRESLPALRRSSTDPLRTTATPAESYPRYSSRRNPSISTGTTSLGPIYPIIPHIIYSLAGPHPRSLMPLSASAARLQTGMAAGAIYSLAGNIFTARGAPPPRGTDAEPQGNARGWLQALVCSCCPPHPE